MRNLLLLSTLLLVSPFVVSEELFSKSNGTTNMSDLHAALVKSWSQLDKLLFCTRQPGCPKVYGMLMKTNIVEKIRIVVHRIKKIMSMVKQISRYTLSQLVTDIHTHSSHLPADHRYTKYISNIGFPLWSAGR